MVSQFQFRRGDHVDPQCAVRQRSIDRSRSVSRQFQPVDGRLLRPVLLLDVVHHRLQPPLCLVRL